MATARGRFEVQLAATGGEPPGENPHLGRNLVDKRYFGDLDASSHGEMLTAITPVEGSAGYVLLERVEGSLSGRPGSFVLQHYGRLTRGTATLTIEVVPDSGTDGLVGLQGHMTIRIETDGTHFYEFDYRLPASSGGP